MIKIVKINSYYIITIIYIYIYIYIWNCKKIMSTNIAMNNNISYRLV